MGIKFGRNYSLLIQPTGADNFRNPLIIEPPFSLEFDIVRNNNQSSNISRLKIYNLAQTTRNKIRKDQYASPSLKQVILQAGYGNNLSIVLNSNITNAYSVREGSTFITYISAFDGGYAYQNAVSDFPVAKNTPQQAVIDRLIQDLHPYQVVRGSVGTFAGTIPRGNAVSGPTVETLFQITGGAFYIDSGKAHVLTDAECIETEIPIISSESGLLGTPRRELSLITFDMLFEPSLQVGQLVNLQSDEGGPSGANFNGLHKVTGLHHHGIISPAVAGPAITTVEMQGGSFTPISEDE